MNSAKIRSWQIAVVILVILNVAVLSFAKSFVDRVCKLTSDPGEKCPDSAEKEMYYFDTKTERCLTFKYLGCEGNDNKFESTDDCIDSCQNPYLRKKEQEEDAKPTEPHKKSDCALKPIPGDCKALITMYYYNPEKKVCEMFGYGGCGGNGNKFDSKGQCEQFCGS